MEGDAVVAEELVDEEKAVRGGGDGGEPGR